MSKKTYIITTILVSFLIILSFSCATTEVSEPVQFKNEINVMSFNIHHCAPGTSAYASMKDVQKIAKFINDNDIDICGLNEVDNEFGSKDTSRSTYINQPKSIAELNKSFFVFGSTLSTTSKGLVENTKYIESGNWDFSIEPEDNKGNFGNAIISRFQIDQMNNYGLPKIEGSEKRACLYAQVNVNNLIPYHIFVTHLAHDSHTDRINQIKGILTIIKKIPDNERIIFMGDLNFDPEASPDEENIIEKIKEIGLKDSAEAIPGKSALKTYPEDNPQRRIDYIFTSPNITISDYKVINTKLSDHQAVIATIKLK